MQLGTQRPPGGLAAEQIFLLIFYAAIYSAGMSRKTQWSGGLGPKDRPWPSNFPEQGVLGRNQERARGGDGPGADRSNTPQCPARGAPGLAPDGASSAGRGVRALVLLRVRNARNTFPVTGERHVALLTGASTSLFLPSVREPLRIFKATSRLPRTALCSSRV